MKKCLKIAFFIISYTAFFMFGIIFIEFLSKISFVVNIEKNTDCINLSLPDIMDCLKNKTNPNYNISNVGKVMTEQRFLEEGGVCKHYSDWYEDKTKEYGFHAKTIIFPIEFKSYHQITIISNSEGYCLADQQLIKCFQYSPI